MSARLATSISAKVTASGSDIEWHRDMLADRHRVESFWRVLGDAVCPGDIVVDIGTGTGLLALMAARAGASRVYAIERGDIIELARDIARRNDLDDRIEFIRGDSRKIDLPERADLVIGEIVGSLGVDEEIIDIFADARRRFLKPGGRLLPDSLDLIAAPSEEGEQLGGWERALETECGLSFAPFTELARHLTSGVWADSLKLLGEGRTLLSCDFYDARPGVLHGEVETSIARAGTLSGWATWFVARFNGKPFISTQPPIDGSSWENVLFPIGEPTSVLAGDLVSLRLRRDDPFWSWESKVGDTVRGFCDLNGVPGTDLISGGARGPIAAKTSTTIQRGIA